MDYLTLDEVQDELLHLLKRVVQFLSENDLKYALDAGTLLGAIRHKGFIPWDDDVDISMPRPDYDRLMLMADKMPDGLRLISWDNSTFPLSFAKIENTKIRAEEDLCEGIREECLWIDVFPVDGFPSDKRAQRRHHRKIVQLRRLRLYTQYGPLKTMPPQKKALVVCYSLLPCRKSRGRGYQQMLESLFRAYRYEDSQYLCMLANDSSSMLAFRKTDYEPFCTASFCGDTFSIPGNSREILMRLYGEDYMTLPPENERHTHSISAWRILQ